MSGDRLFLICKVEMRVRHTLRPTAKAAALIRAAALLAMFVQVLLFADHIGASAAKSLGQFAPGATLGFMELCTGEGAGYSPPGSTPQGHMGDCPICTNASVLAFGEPVALEAPALPFVSVDAVRIAFSDAAVAEAQFLGFKPIRAPPRARL